MLHLYVEMVCHGAYVCGGCSKEGRVVEVCSVGRVCGDVMRYMHAASGRGEACHDVCERKIRCLRGSK